MKILLLLIISSIVLVSYSKLNLPSFPSFGVKIKKTNPSTSIDNNIKNIDTNDDDNNNRIDNSNNDNNNIDSYHNKNNFWRQTLKISTLSFPAISKSFVKNTLKLSIKSVIAVYISRAVIRRVTRWYADFVREELLLDSRDHRYKSFGSIMHLTGANIVKKCEIDINKYKNEINLMDISMNLNDTSHRLRDSMSMACYPHALGKYSRATQASIEVLLLDVETLLDLSGRIRKRHHRMILEEHALNIMCGVCILTARYADAQLRLSRAQLLDAINRAEYALLSLSDRLASSTGLSLGLGSGFGMGLGKTTDKLPLTRTIKRAWQLRTERTGRERTRKAEARDEIIRRHMVELESWLHDMYIQAANIQNHLDSLANLEARSESVARERRVKPALFHDWTRTAAHLSVSTSNLLSLPLILLSGSTASIDIDDNKKSSSNWYRNKMNNKKKKNNNNNNNNMKMITGVTSDLPTHVALPKVRSRDMTARMLMPGLRSAATMGSVATSAQQAAPRVAVIRTSQLLAPGGVHTAMQRLTLLGKKIRFMVKVGVWITIGYGSYLARQNFEDISRGIGLVRDNTGFFVRRRIVKPTSTIMNDVFLNKKVAIADKKALLDSKNALGTMLDDFMKEFNKDIPAEERARKVEQMDMQTISEEYTRELRKPIQNIVSGRIARLALIQLEFVKKELLVAMQALDDLVNANMINLQLLAVFPVILLGAVGKASTKILLSFVRGIYTGSRSRKHGAVLGTKQTVRRELRSQFRALERMLVVGGDAGISPNTQTQGFIDYGSSGSSSSGGGGGGGNEKVVQMTEASKVVKGRLMSVLCRMHRTLSGKSELLDDVGVAQLQLDLSDLMTPGLQAKDQMALLELCRRSHPLFNTGNKN